LQLAAMILEDLATSSEFDDAWSEQDLRDLLPSRFPLLPLMNKTTKPSDSGALVIVDFPGVTALRLRLDWVICRNETGRPCANGSKLR
jgi:hypothetical protein